MATMRSLLPPRFHYYLYVFALLMLAASMPFSRYLMSLSQLILLGNWILEGQLSEKFRRFRANKPALVLSSLLLLHFIGLFYTTDFNYAINDIRIKLPLLALPLILSTSKPLRAGVFRLLLLMFVAATFCATIISSLILLEIIKRDVVDIRNVSVFISHIRFALLICISIFVCIYFYVRNHSTAQRILSIAAAVWFVIFLVLIESLTGLLALAVTAGLIGFYALLRMRRPVVTFATLGITAAASIAIFYFIKDIGRDHTALVPMKDAVLLEKTAGGKPYAHDPTNLQVENGHYVWLNYNFAEMEAAWDRKSEIKFHELDLKGNELRFTLLRFLASKGVTKDSVSVMALTPEEISAVQHGVANHKYQNISSLKGRIHETMWEIRQYRNTGDANGRSLAQRFEFWKTGLSIVGNDPLIGVGTGDPDLAFQQEYERSGSTLLPEWRLRSHNQYLAIAVAFGIIGLLWFLFTLIYPMFALRRQNDFLYMSFFIVAMISFLNEDTLETQAGVTFYAFFNTIFLFMEREADEPYLAPAEIRPLLFSKFS